MDRKYKLYVHISPSGKKYYGITQQKPEKRWQNGNGYKKNPYFYKAIQKYGWDNFTHEVLFDNLTKEEAELMEKLYICLYNTTDLNNGYNLTLGGEGHKHTDKTKKKLSQMKKGKKIKSFTEEHKNKISEAHKGKHLSEETKKKLSQINKGENHPMYGKHLSEKHKKKIGDAQKGENHWNYGKITSEETKQKISASTKGGNNHKAKKIICLNTMEVFDCIKDASEKMDLNYDGLKTCIRRNGKYKGYTFMYYQDYLDKKVS